MYNIKTFIIAHNANTNIEAAVNNFVENQTVVTLSDYSFATHPEHGNTVVFTVYEPMFANMCCNQLQTFLQDFENALDCDAAVAATTFYTNL